MNIDMQHEQSNLFTIDIVVLCLSLALSLSVGIYHAIASRRRVALVDKQGYQSQSAETDEYLMGGHNMPLIPVGLSLISSFLSGILMIAVPGEIFERGILWWIKYPAAVIAMLIAAYIFLPIFHSLRSTSMFEYLQRRFHSKLLRRLCAIVWCFNTLVHTAAAIYAPSLALSQILHVETWIIILIIGSSTTLYTTVGGLKAVVWTDALQALFMYVGVVILVVKGLQHVGGISRVIEIAEKSGRLEDIIRLDPSPAQYNSTWLMFFGYLIMWTATFGTNQMAIQRYCSIGSMHDARLVLFGTMPVFFALASMSCFIGLIMLADFYECNPLETGAIHDRDQLVIVFAKKVLQNFLPGAFGLYLSCLLSSTLGTFSSSVNSVAAVVFEDFIKPPKQATDQMSDKTAVRINKFLALTFGIVSSLMAFACQPLGGIIRVITNTINALSGPLFGLFCAAIFLPTVGRRSALTAFIITSIAMIFLCIDNFYENAYAYNFIPTNTTDAGCHHREMNITIRYQPTSFNVHYGNPSTSYFSRISVFGYPIIGTVAMILLSLLFSKLFRERKIANIDALLYFKNRQIIYPVQNIEILERIGTSNLRKKV